MNIGWITPFLGEVGGIRSIIETGNCLKRMGHDFYMITNRQSSYPAWIEYIGGIIDIQKAKQIKFHVIVNQDPFCKKWDEGIQSKIRVLHHCSAYLGCVDDMIDDYDVLTTCFTRGFSHLSKVTKKQIFFIGQGVNQKQFYPSKNKKEISNNVFFCCRGSNVNNQKGPNTAYNLLKNSHGKYFVSTWDNSYDSRFKDVYFILCTAGINRNSYAETIYHKADVVVALDEISAWNCIAGEAMACGIPVVSNGEGMEDFGISDYNYTLLDNTWDIEHCIDYILSNDDYREGIIKNGIKTMELFTWEKTAKRFVSFIEPLI